MDDTRPNVYYSRSSMPGVVHLDAWNVAHTQECLRKSDLHIFSSDTPYTCYCQKETKQKLAPRNPAYVVLIHKMLETHEIKSYDYADDNNPFSNFEFAAQIAKGFNDEVDKVFVTLIGIKLARLQQLLNGKSPKNESIDDTFLDQTNYSAIWASYRMKRG